MPWHAKAPRGFAIVHSHRHRHVRRLPGSREEIEIEHEHPHPHTGLTAALLPGPHEPRHREHLHTAVEAEVLEAAYRRLA